MKENLQHHQKEFQSFHDFPIVTDLDNFEADIAFLVHLLEIHIPWAQPVTTKVRPNICKKIL